MLSTLPGLVVCEVGSFKPDTSLVAIEIPGMSFTNSTCCCALRLRLFKLTPTWNLILKTGWKASSRWKERLMLGACGLPHHFQMMNPTAANRPDSPT